MQSAWTTRRSTTYGGICATALICRQSETNAAELALGWQKTWWQHSTFAWHSGSISRHKPANPLAHLHQANAMIEIPSRTIGCIDQERRRDGSVETIKSRFIPIQTSAIPCSVTTASAVSSAA